MNYRHAYHAGNHADCLKHALLVWLLGALRRKPAAFTVLDTHAGIGAYDLSAPESRATGEWQDGIGKLWAMPAIPAPLGDYLALASDPPSYPGSPAIVRALLRPQDELICCELNAHDAAILRRRFVGDRQVAVHCRDGYLALKAFLPAAKARGLVLIDPPYEQADEETRIIDALCAAASRFPTGVLTAWYPIKHLAPVRLMHRIVADRLRDAVAAGFWLRRPLDPQRLNGSGLLVVNPPFGFVEAAKDILAALCACLGGPEAGYAVERLADE